MSKKMRFLSTTAAAAVVCLWSGPSQAAFVPVATDTLTYSADISAFGEWANTGTSLSYTVSVDQNSALWQYQYTWSAPIRGLSHIILEVTGGDNAFTLDNLIAWSSDPDSTLDPAAPTFYSGPSNPGIPEPLWGVKWDLDPAETTFSLTLVSDRAPMWGDFYAKDGRNPETYAYNVGFTAPDDVDPVLNEVGLLTVWVAGGREVLAPNSSSFVFSEVHIMSPDSDVFPPEFIVPLPAAVWLLGAGFLGYLGIGYSRRADAT